MFFTGGTRKKIIRKEFSLAHQYNTTHQQQHHLPTSQYFLYILHRLHVSLTSRRFTRACITGEAESCLPLSGFPSAQWPYPPSTPTKNMKPEVCNPCLWISTESGSHRGSKFTAVSNRKL